MDSLVTSNIRQRPLRSAISVIGVALGVTLVMLFTGLTRGMSNDLRRRATNVRAELFFTRPGSMEITSASTNVSTKYVEKLTQIEGVQDATPVIKYFYPAGTFGVDQVEGVDWNSFSKMNNISLTKGRAPSAADEVVIDEVKASKNHPIGSELRVFGDRPYRVVGIYAPESGARVKMTITALQDALGAGDKCTYILVKCKNEDDQLAVAQRINEQLPGNKIQPIRDLFPSIETAIPALGIFMRALVGVASVLSALVVMLAMYTTITERTREIGILKAMGASRGYIVSEIEREAVLISLMGLIVGFVLSFVAGFGIHKATGLVFEFGGWWALTAAAIGLVGGAVGALYPAMRAASLDPVHALAYE